MMRKIIFTVYLIASSFFCNGQWVITNCGEGQVFEIRSQTDLEFFATSVIPECYGFQGAIIISDDNDGIDPIIDLTPLSILTSTTELSIDNCLNLLSLAGFENIDFSNSFLGIIGNEKLSDLSALMNMTQLGVLEIAENPLIIDLTFLSSLQSSSGGINIQYNPNLTSLSGLQNLMSTNGLVIEGSNNLESLAGLENLTSLEEYLELRFNEKLNDISALENVDPITFSTEGAILIIDNPDLSICNIELLCNVLYRENLFTEILNNGTGCNSEGDILQSCDQTCSTGIFLDGEDDELDFISIPSSNNYSIEFFVKFDNIVPDQRLLASENSGQIYSVYVDNLNQLCLSTFVSSPVPFSDPIITNEWYHIVLSRESPTSFICYINGNQKITQIEISPNLTWSNSQKFGIPYLYTWGRYFNGTIDEFRIWDGPISSDQIILNSSQELIGNENNLIAYYNLNEGSGNIINDLTSNNYTALLNTFSSEEIWPCGVALDSPTEITCNDGIQNGDEEDVDCGGTLCAPCCGSITYSGNQDYESSIVYPAEGFPYDVYSFEITYFNAENEFPSATYPRLLLDYDENGMIDHPNDRSFIMVESDPSDTNTSDGKTYTISVSGLVPGQIINGSVLPYQARIEIQNGCGSIEWTNVDGPTVLQPVNLSIFAADIAFSNNNPTPGESIQVSATIHNSSNYSVENITASLFNMYSETTEPLISGINIPPSGSVQVSWNIVTPTEDAFVPIQISIDVQNAISEINELDNVAIKPFINGNYQGGGTIQVTANLNSSEYLAGGLAYITGQALYADLPVVLNDYSVAGAEVTFTISETGEEFVTRTNNAGFFSLVFDVGNTPGDYSLIGSVTDFTLTGESPPISYSVIPPVCAVDLVPIIEYPSNALIGSTLTGKVTVTNQGCSAADQNTAFHVTFTGNHEEVIIYTVPTLLPGQSETYDLPSIQFNESGITTIRAVADHTELIPESNELNNVDIHHISIQPMAQDLKIKNDVCHDFIVSPTDPEENSEITFSVLVLSAGNSDVLDDFTVSFQYAGMTEMVLVTGGLASRTSQIVSATFPYSLDFNHDHVEVMVDAAESILESDETNNLEVFGGLCRDVVASRISGESRYPFGTAINISGIVANPSRLTFSPFIKTRLEVLGPGIGDWLTIGEQDIQQIPGCGGNATIASVNSFVAPEIGTYVFRFSVDEDNVLNECNESNNVIMKEITFVNIPNYQTLSEYIMPSDLNPDINEEIAIDLTYENIGESNLDSIDVDVFVDGVFNKTIRVPGLVSGGTYTVSIPGTWSSSITGAHIIRTVVNASQENFENLYSNNEATRAVIVGAAPNFEWTNLELAEGNYFPGENIPFNATILNSGRSNGSFTYSIYAESSENTTLITSGNTALQTGESLSIVEEFVPSFSGTYLIKAVIENATPEEFDILDNDDSLAYEVFQYCEPIVTSTADSGPGSLRAALECAHLKAGADTITFDLPGSGPHIIALESELPRINKDSLIIDGTTAGGSVVINIDNLTGLNKLAIRVIGKYSEIYGLHFENNNPSGKATAVYYFTTARNFVLGGENKGNKFTGYWQTAVFTKENLYDGHIANNIFDRENGSIKYGVLINSGAQRNTIGGNPAGRNYFYNNDKAIELRNSANSNTISHNYFEENNYAIYNNATVNGGTNKMIVISENEFTCNGQAIFHTENGNANILPPELVKVKDFYLAGYAEPLAIVEIYQADAVCPSFCQGAHFLGSAIANEVGEFYYYLTESLTVGQKIVVTQTSSLEGTSAFSNCMDFDDECLEVICNDNLVLFLEDDGKVGFDSSLFVSNLDCEFSFTYSPNIINCDSVDQTFPVVVTGFDGFGYYPQCTSTVTVSNPRPEAVIIDGPSELDCQVQETGVYVATIEGGYGISTIEWSLGNAINDGWVIVSGQGTNSVTVISGTNKATLEVEVIDLCGIKRKANFKIACPKEKKNDKDQKKNTNSENLMVGNHHKYFSKVYPNPAKDQLFIDFGVTSDPMQTRFVEIYNQLGQLIERIKSSQLKLEVSLRDYQNGIYIIKVLFDQSGRGETFKVVKT